MYSQEVFLQRRRTAILATISKKNAEKQDQTHPFNELGALNNALMNLLKSLSQDAHKYLPQFEQIQKDPKFVLDTKAVALANAVNILWQKYTEILKRMQNRKDIEKATNEALDEMLKAMQTQLNDEFLKLTKLDSLKEYEELSKKYSTSDILGGIFFCVAGLLASLFVLGFCAGVSGGLAFGFFFVIVGLFTWTMSTAIMAGAIAGGIVGGFIALVLISMAVEGFFKKILPEFFEFLSNRFSVLFTKIKARSEWHELENAKLSALSETDLKKHFVAHVHELFSKVDPNLFKYATNANINHADASQNSSKEEETHPISQEMYATYEKALIQAIDAVSPAPEDRSLFNDLITLYDQTKNLVNDKKLIQQETNLKDAANYSQALTPSAQQLVSRARDIKSNLEDIQAAMNEKNFKPNATDEIMPAAHATLTACASKSEIKAYVNALQPIDLARHLFTILHATVHAKNPQFVKPIPNHLITLADNQTLPSTKSTVDLYPAYQP